MEIKNILKIENFVLDCNNFLEGKFFDLNKRLTKFLNIMTKSEDIMEFLSECCEDFDEEIEFSKAFSIDKKSGVSKINLPTDAKKKIALITSIFNNLSNGKINETQFLETYFQDKSVTSMQNFLEKIVCPYRDLICKHFGISTAITDEDVKKHMEEQQEQEEIEIEAAKEAQFPKLDDLLAKITNISNQILSLLKFEKKRTDVLDDVEFVTNSIISECSKRDLMVVNGLVIGLNYMSKKFKNIKHLVDELNTEIYDYYEFLAENSKPSENQQQSGENE